MEERNKTVRVRSLVLGDGIPKICIPVTAANLQEMEQQIDALLLAPCDLVEWRADFFDPECAAQKQGWLEECLALLRDRLQEKPLLFTFRTKQEGGERSISPEEYEQLCGRAAGSGLADLIDVELNRGEDLLRRLVCRKKTDVLVLASFHDFRETPEPSRICEILCQMQTLGADLTKAAVMPRREEDVLRLLEASLLMKRRYADRPYITMSMGRMGSVSRLSGALTGSAVTFATAGRASAPGQLEARLLGELLPALAG